MNQTTSQAGSEEIAAFLSRHPETRWIDAMIPDINGILRGKRLDVSGIGKLFGGGLAMPGSNYALDVMGNNVDSTGMGPTDGDPDYPCQAVPGTLAPVPWLGERQAQVLLSMATEAGEPWWLDVRHILARQVERLAEVGYRPMVAVELEFYLVEPELSDGRPVAARAPGNGIRPIDTQCYLMDELDGYSAILNEVVDTCRLQGIPADVATIEYAPAQFEINLHHTDDPVAACDHAVLMKRAIKGVAAKHGLVATFMARPFAGLSGNGTHIHLSLVDGDGRNAFDDGGPEGTALLRHAIGGLQATMPEAMAIYAPNANSFRRINPTGWVPLAPTWGYNNRTVALRVPGGSPKARRLEHRPSGADANPYLVMATVLAGVHHGVVAKADPGPALTGNAAEKVAPSLPAIWIDALRAHDDASILPEYFGARWWDVYSKLKWSEFHEFNAHVTRLEYDRFLRLI